MNEEEKTDELDVTTVFEDVEIPKELADKDIEKSEELEDLEESESPTNSTKPKKSKKSKDLDLD